MTAAGVPACLMPHNGISPPGRVMGGLVGTIATLVVLAAVLPVITPYVVAIGLLVIVGRVVWFYTNH